jgi:2-oxoisovalerate dehydrogenase E1 component
MGLISNGMNKTSNTNAGTTMLNASYQKKMEIIKKMNLSEAMIEKILKNIFVSRKVDDAEITMKKQNKALFQIY